MPFLAALKTTCSNATEVAKLAAPIYSAVDHSQLRTMTSKTIEPIDWPLPLHALQTVPLECHLDCANVGH